MTHLEVDDARFVILKHARENLAPYRRVRRIVFFELSKTISGKIRRVDLRGREEQAAAGQIQVTEWRDDQFPKLRAATELAEGHSEPRHQISPEGGK